MPRYIVVELTRKGEPSVRWGIEDSQTHFGILGLHFRDQGEAQKVADELNAKGPEFVFSIREDEIYKEIRTLNSKDKGKPYNGEGIIARS